MYLYRYIQYRSAIKGGHSKEQKWFKVLDIYIPSVPGDSADADAYNILQAGLAGNWLYVKTIMDHQVDPSGAESILAVVLAWMVIVLKGFPSGTMHHITNHLREMVEEL